MATACRIILLKLISTLKNARCGPEDPTVQLTHPVTISCTLTALRRRQYTAHGDVGHGRAYVTCHRGNLLAPLPTKGMPRRAWHVHQRTMKALRRLSHSLAVLLRPSASKTTSTHISETVEEPLDQKSSNLSDQQPTASDDDETLATTTMSLQPDILEPTSFLQSLFNLTLVEYSRQTGIDLITHPLIPNLDDICSADKAITALRERSQPFSNPKMDDKMVQLKSIFYIVSLLTPSEALRDNIDPVCQSDLDLTSYVYYLTFTIAIFTRKSYPWGHRCSPCSV